MDALPTAHEVLGAMITPAVLISASGTLVLSTSNRLTRVVDRVRALAAEAEGRELTASRLGLISSQVPQLAGRAAMLRTAMTALYGAIGLLVATSIAIGVSAFLPRSFGWVAVALGLAGAGGLLHGSLLLVREARLAVGSTLEELEHLEKAVSGRAAPPAPGTAAP
jgi:hypothetical protein